jgi:Nif-specific regulatory protein
MSFTSLESGGTRMPSLDACVAIEDGESWLIDHDPVPPTRMRSQISGSAGRGRAGGERRAVDPVVSLPAGAGAPPLAERDRIIAAMGKSGWVQAKAARLLGLRPRQIGYALKKYGVEVKKL